MDDKLITLSEIMKPTHLQKINPLPKNKSMVPFGFGIIPSGNKFKSMNARYELVAKATFVDNDSSVVKSLYIEDIKETNP